MYVEQVEPAQIVMNLRRQRVRLFAAFSRIADMEPPDYEKLVLVNSSLLKTQELMLRMAKVPQAPAGKSTKDLLRDAKQALEAEPIEAVDLRETAGE